MNTSENKQGMHGCHQANNNRDNKNKIPFTVMSHEDLPMAASILTIE